MNKNHGMLFTLFLATALLFAGCVSTQENPAPTPTPSSTATPMVVSPSSLPPVSAPSDSVVAAAQQCVNAFLTNPAYEGYNPNSQTYWFTLKDATGKYPGCSPACVVYENGSTEVNYRCTGLIHPPQPTAGTTLENAQGSCQQNNGSTISFSDENHFAIDFKVSGNICNKYAFTNAVVMQVYPATLLINLKTANPSGEACVACFGYSEARISGDLSGLGTIGAISVTLNGRQAAYFPMSGVHCGGFIKNPPACPSGYYCKLGQIADTGGNCVLNSTNAVNSG